MLTVSWCSLVPKCCAALAPNTHETPEDPLPELCVSLLQTAGRLVALLYELLGGEADMLVRWPDRPPSGMEDPAYFDTHAALDRMLTKQDWQSATRWCSRQHILLGRAIFFLSKRDSCASEGRLLALRCWYYSDLTSKQSILRIYDLSMYSGIVCSFSRGTRCYVDGCLMASCNPCARSGGRMRRGWRARRCRWRRRPRCSRTGAR